MTTLAPESLWMEIEIDCAGSDVRVSGRTCRGQVSPLRSLGPDMTVERIQAFGKRVADAARSEHLPDAVLNEARTIRRAIMDGRLDQMRSELRGAAGSGPVLLRFLITGVELQSVPWETLCDQDGANELWGISTSYLVARGVRDPEPARICRVPGALNVLVVAPLGGPSIEAIRQALSERIALNEVVWLPPIGPDQARLEYLFDRLAMDPAPHIIHFVGHGGLHDGKPALQLAGGTEDDPAWVDVELLGMHLRSAARNVSLFVLEACEGARPGEFSSAAEALCRKGAQAVVAHLWPVRADLAREGSERFYRSLAGKGLRRGDAAAALNDARRALFALHDHTAEAFSPVLYLRSNDARLFELTESAGEGGGELGPDELVKRQKLGKIIGHRRSFSLVLGDRWPHDRQAFEGFKNEIRAKLSEPRRSDLFPPGLPSSALMERAALEIGHSHLETKFQEIFKQVSRPRFIDAIARVLPPGPHITLLRTPLLEQAVESAKPDRTLYVVQPDRDGPIVYCRPANAGEWTDLTELPDTFDPYSEILIFRLYCGYTAAQSFTAPLLTEDDFLGLGGIADALYGRGHKGDNADTVVSALTQRPALLMGLSILAWHHRKLLHDVFEGKQLPSDSLAVVADEDDVSFWTGSRAGRRVRTGLPGDGTVNAISGTADDIDRWLQALAIEDRIRKA